jgi:hypothetical protein
MLSYPKEKNVYNFTFGINTNGLGYSLGPALCKGLLSIVYGVLGLPFYHVSDCFALYSDSTQTHGRLLTIRVDLTGLRSYRPQQTQQDNQRRHCYWTFGAPWRVFWVSHQRLIATKYAIILCEVRDPSRLQVNRPWCMLSGRTVS